MSSSRLAGTVAVLLIHVATICGCGDEPPSTVADPAATSPVALARPRGEITYDHHSLIINGAPVIIQSAEFHYFRLPSPGLWRDVLEKLKAGGFNTISVYFNWAFHSASPGVYDFTGVRDVDRLLRTAEQVGLFVIARPGPYINAETTGGGFPAWLKLVPGRARSSDPGYTAAYRDWLGHINPIIARHQITVGGSVILYNVENEYAVNTDAAYMEDLQHQALAAGITLPITHNACCDAGRRPGRRVRARSSSPASTTIRSRSTARTRTCGARGARASPSGCATMAPRSRSSTRPARSTASTRATRSAAR